MKRKIFTLSVRLRSINSTPNLYQYDWNGNVEDDNLNNNTSITYDHRNLITEITRIDNLSDPPAVYTTRYQYDESGNRIRKFMTKFTETTNDTLINEYYVRDISGREIAIYDNRNTTSVIEYWNIWAGSEFIGRINPNSENDRYYYLKDHLGTIRVILNNSSNIIFAQDYDMWGYPLENRTSGNDTIKNKFTGKERDKESTYDYFGARYYDSRVANWTSPDPLFEKHLQWSPYNYVLRNPVILIDPDGRQIIFPANENRRNYQLNLLKSMVPSMYRDFLTTDINHNGDYILKINSGYNDNNSDIFDRLLNIAGSSEAVKFFFVSSDFEIISNKTNEDGEGTAHLGTMSDGKSLFGFTLVSGRAANISKPEDISLSSLNEVYILNNITSRETVVTIGHELFVHVYNYINSKPWKEKDEGIENEIKKIEKEVKKNYDQ